MTIVLTGIQLFFAAVFTWTAVVKLRDLSRFELVLVQLFGTRPFERWFSSRTAAIVIAGYELALAATIGLSLFEPVSTAALTLTTVAFAAAVWRAWRMHVACGCFPDRRPAEVASLVRSAILIALAATLLVAGPPPIPGPARLAAGLLCAAAIGAGIYLVFALARRLVRRSHPEPARPSMVPTPIFAQIVAGLGRPVPELPDQDGWVEVAAGCRIAGVPVSAVFVELQRRAVPATAPLLATGTVVAPLTGTSVRGEELRPGLPAAPSLVVLFSATCTRCPTHIPDVQAYLRKAGLDRRSVLVVVSGEGEGGERFVTAFDELAIVVVEPVFGPVAEAFSMREFPAYYVIGEGNAVTAASNLIDDLDRVRS